MFGAHAEPQGKRQGQHGNAYLGEKYRPARFGLVDAVFAQVIKQDRGVQARAQTDRQGQSGMLYPADEQRVHRLCRQQGHDADLHRGLDVLPRVKTRREDFHQDQSDQPRAVTDQRPTRHHYIVRDKRAMLKEGRQQRHGDHAQGQRGGQRQHDGQTQAPIQQPGIFRRVVARVAFG